MVVYSIKYANREGTATIYDSWDIKDKRYTVKLKDVTYRDVGKYLCLEDGSRQFVEILKVIYDVVETSSGVYYKWEVLPCVNPRLPHTEFCGAFKGDESLDLIPLTDEERKLAMITTTVREELVVQGSRRVQYVANELVQRRLREKGFTETDIVDKVIDLALGRTNQHTYKALQAIGRASDLEFLDDKSTVKVENKLLPLSAQIGRPRTLAEKRMLAIENAEIIEEDHEQSEE